MFDFPPETETQAAEPAQPLYEMQREMRAMRRAAISRGVIALLDVGTSKIACFVLRVGAGPDIAQRPPAGLVGPMAGQARVKVIGAHATRSRGVRFGEIGAMGETEAAIRTVVSQAQKAAGVRVDHAIATLSGAAPESEIVSGEVPLLDETCAEGDIARALAACELCEPGAGRHVLHAQPVHFALDHRAGLSDPRGQIGRRLATDMHVVTVDQNAVRNLAQCLKRCNLELAGVAGAAYAAGLSALTEDEQELGAACIDMGGGATAISLWMKRHMIGTCTVPMGGDRVTLDISKGLQVPLSLAERIKTTSGGVHATGMDDRELIPLKGESGDWERDRREITRTELIGIMRPRIEEILEGARDALAASDFRHLPGQSVVLTGGASLVPGMADLAGRILGASVRLGRPMRVRGLPQTHLGAQFSAGVGLALFAAQPQDEWWDFELPADRTPARSFKRAIRWFRDHW